MEDEAMLAELEADELEAGTCSSCPLAEQEKGQLGICQSKTTSR